MAAAQTIVIVLLMPLHVIAVRPISSSLAGKARSASDTIATPSLQQELDKLKTSCQAVEMAVCLLDMHPLSQRAQLEAPGQLPTQSSAQSTTAGSTDQQCISSHPSSRSVQWPTPKSSEWADIVLVAERACLALDWALSHKSANQASPEIADQLAVQLCELLRSLVIGHLPDLDLDMRKLFHQGLQPVLAAQLAGYAKCMDPAVAMLSRLAVDCNLLPGGRAYAGPQIISTFCEYTAVLNNDSNCKAFQLIVGQVPTRRA